MTPPRDDTATTAPATLAEQEICRDVLIEKYAKGEELSVDAVRLRVARALAAAEPEERRAHWEQIGRAHV